MTPNEPLCHLYHFQRVRIWRFGRLIGEFYGTAWLQTCTFQFFCRYDNTGAITDFDNLLDDRNTHVYSIAHDSKHYNIIIMFSLHLQH